MNEQEREALPPLPPVDYDAGWHRQYTADQMHAYARAALAAKSTHSANVSKPSEEIDMMAATPAPVQAQAEPTEGVEHGKRAVICPACFGYHTGKRCRPSIKEQP